MNILADSGFLHLFSGEDEGVGGGGGEGGVPEFCKKISPEHSISVCGGKGKYFTIHFGI